jgi:deoxyribodipyrimidine photo-lyase
MTTSLVWFRRDLRLHDNPALSAAVAASKTVFAVFCAEDMAMLNARQRAFVASALQHLRATLGRADASLTVLDGDCANAIESAARRLGATAVFCARAFDRRERASEQRTRQAVENAGIQWRAAGSPAVHDPEAVAELKQAPGEGYRVFPPFYQAWKALAVERPLPARVPNGSDPTPGVIPAEAALQGSGTAATEPAAQDLLQRFVTARAGDYGANAEYPGRNATSLLAPHLRFGLLSARSTYHAIAQKMARSWTLAEERLSMEAFLRRLALRDFFTHLAYFAPDVYEEPLQEKMRGFPWSRDDELVAAWASGKTGYPLVDAAMRQLSAQGEVHQRAAIVAASFCIADLGLDWRIGRDVWMRELLAADEALCVGNWQRIAGIGSDQAAYPRIYNPRRQAQLFDSQATYVRRHCAELAKLPTRAALAPWEIGTQQQVELGFFTPQQYPAPIVDHEEAAREFLRRYQAYRNRSS